MLSVSRHVIAQMRKARLVRQLIQQAGTALAVTTGSRDCVETASAKNHRMLRLRRDNRWDAKHNVLYRMVDHQC